MPVMQVPSCFASADFGVPATVTRSGAAVMGVEMANVELDLGAAANVIAHDERALNQTPAALFAEFSAPTGGGAVKALVQDAKISSKILKDASARLRATEEVAERYRSIISGPAAESVEEMTARSSMRDQLVNSYKNIALGIEKNVAGIKTGKNPISAQKAIIKGLNVARDSLLSLIDTVGSNLDGYDLKRLNGADNDLLRIQRTIIANQGLAVILGQPADYSESAQRVALTLELDAAYEKSIETFTTVIELREKWINDLQTFLADPNGHHQNKKDKVRELRVLLVDTAVSQKELGDLYFSNGQNKNAIEAYREGLKTIAIAGGLRDDFNDDLVRVSDSLSIALMRVYRSGENALLKGPTVDGYPKILKDLRAEFQPLIGETDSAVLRMMGYAEQKFSVPNSYNFNVREMAYLGLADADLHLLATGRISGSGTFRAVMIGRAIDSMREKDRPTSEEVFAEALSLAVRNVLESELMSHQRTTALQSLINIYSSRIFNPAVLKGLIDKFLGGVIDQYPLEYTGNDPETPSDVITTLERATALADMAADLTADREEAQAYYAMKHDFRTTILHLREEAYRSEVKAKFENLGGDESVRARRYLIKALEGLVERAMIDGRMLTTGSKMNVLDDLGRIVEMHIENDDRLAALDAVNRQIRYIGMFREIDVNVLHIYGGGEFAGDEKDSDPIDKIHELKRELEASIATDPKNAREHAFARRSEREALDRR